MSKIRCNDGTNLFYKISGQGHPLVLIAGGFCDHQVWDDVVPLLDTYSGNCCDTYFQVIIYDHRGIGKSNITQTDYTVSLLANDLLTQLNIPSAHIIGHSMGGFIAQYFSAFYPEKILSLSLLSSLLTMNLIGLSYLDNLIYGLKNDANKIRQSMPEKAGQLQAIDSIYQ